MAQNTSAAELGPTNGTSGVSSGLIDRSAEQLSFGLSGISYLQAPLWGHPRWRYAASALYILLAFVLSRLVDWFIRHRLRLWARRSPGRWDDILVGLIDGPLKLATFVVLLNVGLLLFGWPSWVGRNISRLTILLLALSIVLVLLRAVDAAIEMWRGKTRAGGDRTFNEVFLVNSGRLAKIAVCILAVLTVLPELGWDVRALLGGFSIFGLALGLAAQDTVSNLFGAVAVFLDRPFQIGDQIQVGGVEGKVEEIGLRATKVRSLDGFLITVPNKTVGNNTVVNVSARPTIKTELNFGLPYDLSSSQLQQAIDIISQNYQDHPSTADLIVTFNRFADSWLNVQVFHWWRGNDGRAQLQDLQRLNLRLKERLDAVKIEFAYPTQTVHQKKP